MRVSFPINLGFSDFLLPMKCGNLHDALVGTHAVGEVNFDNYSSLLANTFPQSFSLASFSNKTVG